MRIALYFNDQFVIFQPFISFNIIIITKINIILSPMSQPVFIKFPWEQSALLEISVKRWFIIGQTGCPAFSENKNLIWQKQNPTSNLCMQPGKKQQPHKDYE